MWSSGSFNDDWQAAAPHIRAALQHCGDPHTLDDVMRMVMARDAELYVGGLSAVVTQELNLPTGRQLHFWLAGGDLNELIKIERDVEHAAKARGIRRISIIGRRGWQRKLDGFNEAGVVLTKDI